MSDSLSTTSIHPSWDSLLAYAESAPESDRLRVKSLFADGAEIEAIGELIDQIDDSNYSASDWVIALATFDRWLEDSGVKARPLDSMSGYVHCCTMTSAETLAAPPLDQLLLKMLDEYGFEATQGV